MDPSTRAGPAERPIDQGSFTYGSSSQPRPSNSAAPPPPSSSLQPTPVAGSSLRRLSSHERSSFERSLSSGDLGSSEGGVGGAGPSGSTRPAPLDPSRNFHATQSQHQHTHYHPHQQQLQQTTSLPHQHHLQQGHPPAASLTGPSGRSSVLPSGAAPASSRMASSSQHAPQGYHPPHDGYYAEQERYEPSSSSHTRAGPHHPSYPPSYPPHSASTSSHHHGHPSQLQFLAYSASYPDHPPPPSGHHYPPPDQSRTYDDGYGPPPSTSAPAPYPPPPMVQLAATKSAPAPAPATKVKKPSAAAAKKAAAAAAVKAGPEPVQLEYRLVNGVRMVVGKQGRLFDPNPAPGCGTVDFECCFCDKVYQGKHARSIWRRHLCDKHGIPLSDQPRRTRWDKNETRPKTDEERRERSLESKRKWATKRRAAKRAARTGSQVVSGDDDDDDLGSELDDGDASQAEEPAQAAKPETSEPSKKAPVKAAAKKKAVPAKAPAAKGKGKAPARSSSVKAKKDASPEPTPGEEQEDDRADGGGALDFESEDDADGSRSRTSSGLSSQMSSPYQSHSRVTSAGSSQSHSLYTSRPLHDYQPTQTYAQPWEARQPPQHSFQSHPPPHPSAQAHPQAPAYHRPPPSSAPYQEAGHYPPAPAVPVHFQVPRRPLSAFGSASSAAPASTMTMPGFSPQRRSSVPPPRMISLATSTPSQPARQPVEDDGAAAILMALRADGSSPVKPTGEVAGGSVVDSEEGSQNGDALPTERVSPFVKDEVNDEAQKELERRKVERQTLFPIAPKHRQPSFNGRPSSSSRAASSEATIVPAVLAAALSPPSLPNSSPVKEAAAPSSPPMNGANFLESSSPASPAMNGRSPPSANRTEKVGSSPVISSIRFTSREMPAPATRSANKSALGTPTPLARLAGTSSVPSRPAIVGLRFGEDARKRMSVSRSSLGTTPSRWGVSRGAGDENDDEFDDENDDPLPSGGGGVDSRSASDQEPAVVSAEDDEDEDEDDEIEERDEDDTESVKPFGSSPLGLSPTKTSRPALEPLFPPPQVPHHRRPSSTPALLSAGGAGANATLLPIFHPTPFKPTHHHTTNISSTRTPFKPSSSSSHNPSSSSTPNNALSSSQARYGSSIFGRDARDPASSSRTHTSTLMGSSPPASSFFQLSSPQSLSLTRSLGLAPATPGNVWGGGGGAGAETPEMVGRKRKGSWAEREREGKKVKMRERDSGVFFEGMEDGEGVKREVE